MQIRLDRVGDVPPREDEHVVSTEVEWLRAALNSEAILVRGEALCSWAERFCAWRGIPYEEVPSPTKRLQEALGLDREVAHAIAVQLNGALPEPLTATTLLALLAPHPTLWHGTPTLSHAAAWLLWLSEQRDDDPLLAPLITLAAHNWRESAPTAVRDYYKATCPAEAASLLGEWLGIQPSQRVFEPFPIPLPARWMQQAREAWLQQLVETDGNAWRRLWSLPLHESARHCMAQTLSEFFTSRPEKLTEEVLEALQPHLSEDAYCRLRSLIAPKVPADPPTDTDALLEWFEFEYLPYREWHHLTNTPEAQEHITRLARSFARQLLSYYPSALLRNDEHLAFVQVGRLLSAPERNDTVTLIVVLDGMAHWNARALERLLRENLPKLHLTESRRVFAALPTLTEFSKNALFTAAPPRNALSDETTAVGVIIPDHENPAEMVRSASPGSVFFWRVAEPDQTYHKRNQDKMLSESVHAELHAVVQKLRRVVDALPEDCPMRLVITSDHGRLLGHAARRLTPPEGWQSRERAAYLVEGEGRCYEACGYAIEGDLVYLSPVSFGLPCDVVCVLSDEAFLDAAGKGGTVAYPHGGLYPEEVIVDWLVYERQPRPVQAQVILQGKGRPRKPAVLELTVRNLAATTLTLVALQDRGERLSLIAPRTRVPAYSKVEVQVRTDAFPDTPQMLAIDALLQTPSGDLHRCAVETHLETETMYHSEPILEDLL